MTHWMRENRDKGRGSWWLFDESLMWYSLRTVPMLTTWSLLVGSGCIRSRTFLCVLNKLLVTGHWWSPEPLLLLPLPLPPPAAVAQPTLPLFVVLSFSRCARFLKAQMITFKPVENTSKSMLPHAESVYLHLSIFFWKHIKLSCCAFKVLQKVMKSLQNIPIFKNCTTKITSFVFADIKFCMPTWMQSRKHLKVKGTHGNLRSSKIVRMFRMNINSNIKSMSVNFANLSTCLCK